MNIMKFFGFETDEDDYDDYDDAPEEKRTRKPAPKRESQSRTSSGNTRSAGRLIVYNGIADDNDKRRLREAFNDGAMILIDLHMLNQREFDEQGKDFITFMGGVAFARNGEIKYLEPAQYIVTPSTGMFEIWPEGGTQE